MTETTAADRPRQVTLAAWLIMGGSALVVLTAFDRITGLQSLETRQAVQQFLAESPGNQLAVDEQGVIGILRALAMVAAGCATAAGILGYHVLLRNRAARLALTLLALPLFLAGMVAGGFMSSVVAASAVMLWLSPAREWFNGQALPAPRTAASPPTDATDPVGRTDAGPEAPAGPRAFHDFGAPAVTGSLPQGDAESFDAVPARRPSALVRACVLTWVGAGATAVLMVSSMAAFAADPGLVLDELYRQNPELAAQGITEDLLVRLTFAMAGAVLVWCLGAILLAALAFRGIAWARVGLVVSAAVTAGLCLLGVLGQVVMLLPAGVAVLTLVLLARADVRAWFRR